MKTLLGLWHLQSYENFDKSGVIWRITQGQRRALEYSVDGNARVSIRRDPEQLKSLGLSENLANIQYHGRYEVDEGQHTVFHHIETSNDPRRVGQVLIRKYTLFKDLLEIEDVGLEGRVKLTWSRKT